VFMSIKVRVASELERIAGDGDCDRMAICLQQFCPGWSAPFSIVQESGRFIYPGNRRPQETGAVSDIGRKKLEIGN